jgi:FlaA1/EpsC-like NDP-sugar epimerase
MMRTNGYNGYSNRPSLRVILAFFDCPLIIAGVFSGVFMGGILALGAPYSDIVISRYAVWKIIAFVLVIQITFYFLDLYDVIDLREPKKIALSLLKSLGISFFVLAIVSYSVPTLAISRGILGLSLMVIFALVFFWRLVFAGICRNIIKERILIVGKKDLSQKIAREIYENGRDTFEIIGFVEERTADIGRSPEFADHRKL